MFEKYKKLKEKFDDTTSGCLIALVVVAILIAILALIDVIK